MKKFFIKLRKTYKYYKSLSGKSKKPEEGTAKIRPDAVAFLTCPYPVLKSEHKSDS